MQAKQRDGGERVDKNLKTSIKVQVTLEELMSHSHANGRRSATKPIFIKAQQETPSKEVSSQIPCNIALACAIISSVWEEG